MTDLLCDSGRGSTCNAATLGKVLDTELTAMVPRPGSVLRVWIMVERVSETEVVVTIVSPSITRGAAGNRERRPSTFDGAVTARHGGGGIDARHAGAGDSDPAAGSVLFRAAPHFPCLFSDDKTCWPQF